MVKFLKKSWGYFVAIFLFVAAVGVYLWRQQAASNAVKEISKSRRDLAVQQSKELRKISLNEVEKELAIAVKYSDLRKQLTDKEKEIMVESPSETAARWNVWLKD